MRWSIAWGNYLSLRASRSGELGASCDALIALVRRNATIGISAELAKRIAMRLVPLAMKPVQVDSKLHAWEWAVMPDGTLMKTDAYDHHAAHDLIGVKTSRGT